MPLPSSEAFKSVVKYGHRIHSRALLLREGQPDSSVPLLVVEGSASDDKSNDIRGKCTVTLVDPKGELVPTDAESALFPGYNEIQLYRGVYLPDGTLEEFSLGVFGFDEVTSSNAGQRQVISIAGFDRSRRISDAKFLDTFTASGTVGPIIQAIVTPRLPFASFNLPTGGYSVRRVVFSRGDDPWKACKELAASAGMDLYFDRNGTLTMEPFSESTAYPDWTFSEGSEAVMLNIDKRMARAQYNHWVEIGEGGSISVPFTAEAKDDEDIAASGDRPYFHVSSFYTSQSQAKAAADAQKLSNQGATELIQLTTIPNPAILVNDRISIEDSRNSINAIYIVDKVTTPMKSITGQNLTTRVRRV